MSNGVTPLNPEQTAEAETSAQHEGYLHRVLVGLDQFVNVVAGGHPDETISSRLARGAEKGNPVGEAGIEVLDAIQPNHGALAVAGDEGRAKAIESVEESSGIIKP